MHTMPMNRWYISRAIMSVSMQDFAEAVDGLRQDMEKLSGDKYDLKISFYKAAAPHDPNTPQPKPDVLVKEIASLGALRRDDWSKAGYVEAKLATKTSADSAVASKFSSAVVSAKWPSRGIHFHVEPAQNADALCRQFLGNRFIMWSKGLVPLGY